MSWKFLCNWCKSVLKKYFVKSSSVLTENWEIESTHHFNFTVWVVWVEVFTFYIKCILHFGCVNIVMRQQIYSACLELKIHSYVVSGDQTCFPSLHFIFSFVSKLLVNESGRIIQSASMVCSLCPPIKPSVNLNNIDKLCSPLFFDSTN